MFPVKNNKIVYREEQDGAVFFHPIKNTILRLNTTGFEIWYLCDGKKSVEDIANILSKRYKKNKEKVKKDVIDFIKKLKAYDWIALKG